jgi:hypothetical protein
LIWLNSLIQGAFAVRNSDPWAIAVYAITVTITSVYCLLYLWYSTGNFRTLAWILLGSKTFFVGCVLFVEFTFFANSSYKKDMDELHNVLTIVVGILVYLSPAMEVVSIFFCCTLNRFSANVHTDPGITVRSYI